MLKAYLTPLHLIKKEKVLFGIWFVFIIVFGSAGVFASIINQDWSYCALLKHIHSGTFYIVSLTLVATYFSDLLSDIYLQKDAKSKKYRDLFHEYKIISFIVAIVLFFIIALIYPGIEKGTSTSDFSIYWFQFGVFLITAFLGAYIFSLKHVYLHQKEMEGLHNQAVKKLITTTEEQIDDDEGMKF